MVALTVAPTKRLSQGLGTGYLHDRRDLPLGLRYRVHMIHGVGQLCSSIC